MRLVRVLPPDPEIGVAATAGPARVSSRGPKIGMEVIARLVWVLSDDRGIGGAARARSALVLASDTKIRMGARVWPVRIRPLDPSSGILSFRRRNRQMAGEADRLVRLGRPPGAIGRV
jgi:hypothetical protein